MDKFETLLNVTKHICKDKDINFLYLREDMILGYIFKFEKLNKTYKFTLKDIDLHTKPFNVIKTDIEHVISLLENEISTNILLIDLINHYVEHFKSLCDDDKIYFDYYNDIENGALSFRFEKLGKVFRHKISYSDLQFKHENIITNEIYKKLNELIDIARG